MDDGIGAKALLKPMHGKKKPSGACDGPTAPARGLVDVWRPHGHRYPRVLAGRYQDVSNGAEQHAVIWSRLNDWGSIATTNETKQQGGGEDVAQEEMTMATSERADGRTDGRTDVLFYKRKEVAREAFIKIALGGAQNYFFEAALALGTCERLAGPHPFHILSVR